MQSIGQAPIRGAEHAEITFRQFHQFLPSVVAFGFARRPVQFATADGFFMANALLTKVWEKDHGFRDSALNVFLLVADNANRDGICWPSVETMALFCRVSPRMVQRQLRVLEDSGFIRTVKRTGTSNVYEINEAKLDGCRDLRPRKQGVNSSSSPGGVTPMSPGGELQFTPGVTPMSPKPVLNPQEPSFVEEKAEAIYQAYPRKIAKDSALKAIRKILAKYPAEKLLSATLAFAAAVERWPEDDKRFVPYPATWFNRGSYNDDPKNWARTYDANNRKSNGRGFESSNLAQYAVLEQRMAADV